MTHVIETEAHRVMEASLNREERNKRFGRPAEMTESDRSSPSSESQTTDIFDERNNEKAYLDADSDEKERQRRKMKGQDRHISDKRKLKSRNPLIKSIKVTMLKVIKTVN